MKRYFALVLAGILMLLSTTSFAAEADAAAAAEQVQTNLNVVWTVVAAFLVFLMQAGFALVEAGFTRAKNAVNIIMKNLMDFSIGSLGFLFVGFGLMFGATNGLFGTTDFMLSEATGDAWDYTFLMFQTVFAATAATIVSGAMAERTKFGSYLIYSVIVTMLIYPVFGSWAWGSLFKGSGWLEGMGFVDFAGSTVVHSVGGWVALAGAIVIGPRLGKYGPDKKPRAILGHNMTFAALGVFLLWFGWFGFNPGSTTTGDGSIGRIAVTTNLAAAAGVIGALITGWILFKKPDASMTLNGALAGLVGITAPCATVTPMGAILIGLVAGVIVVFSILLFDAIFKVDDPVGAISVHGVCGAWGTLAAGLFNAEAALGIGEANTGLFYGGGAHQLGVQAIGVAAAFGWAFIVGFILFFAIKKTVGLRVSKEEEIKGLDLSEHGSEAYAGFQIYLNQ
ncbi:MAG: ammonium transporter [Deltaproteobacteria bacterium]|nr:ammonium transporter [Deltaproteobacteria bacterium]